VVAAVRHDIVVVTEHAVGQPVVAHELPDVFHHVQLRALGRQRQQGNVGRQRDIPREMPPGLIEQQYGVPARFNHVTDLGEVQVHRRRVAERQDQGRALALQRTDGTENVGGGITLVLRRGGPGAALRPAAGDAVLLTDPGFVLEPDLYGIGADALVCRDARQRGGEVFLNAAMAPSACA